MLENRLHPTDTTNAKAAMAAGVALLATGCATPIGVKRIRPEEANRQLTASVLTTGKPGARAQEFLYRLNLSEKFREDPAGTINELHAGLGHEDESDRLFALAELSFDYAEHGGARSYYLASAAYAWAFLFPENPASRPDCYDPRARTRDLIRLRTNYRKDPPEDAYLFRTNAPPENVRRLFLSYLKKINELKEHPEFYNTLTTNCTTNVLMHTRVNPGTHTYSWKILLSGYAPLYTYELGRLDTSLPFEELKRRSHINAAAQAADQAADFSQRIRAGLPKPAARASRE